MPMYVLKDSINCLNIYCKTLIVFFNLSYFIKSHLLFQSCVYYVICVP